MEFSAVLSGWRFLACCRTLRLDPQTLPQCRREAIDTAMLAALDAASSDHDDRCLAELESRLRHLLMQPLH